MIKKRLMGKERKLLYRPYYMHLKVMTSITDIFLTIRRQSVWILRFEKNCKRTKSERLHQDLTADEYQLVENKIVFLIQDVAFLVVFNLRLYNFLPFIDGNWAIRISTNISNKRDTNEFCHPALLPNHNHPVVSRMIMDVYQESYHAGIQLIMPILRERFWILRGQRTVGAVVNSYLRCKRHTAKNIEAIHALPENKVRNVKLVEVTGVDMAGPLYLKTGRDEHNKAWIYLSTCGVYRADAYSCIFPVN